MKKKIIAVLCVAAMMASSGMPAYAKAKKTYITPASASIKVNAKKVIALKNNRKAVRWSTSTKNVVLSKKSKKGVTVTGKKAGSATVTAKVGKKIYKAKIKVTKVGLSTTKKTLKKGSYFTLKMSGKKVKLWSVSSSKTVLKLTKKTASSVKVTAVGTGSATVIAETVKPYKMYKCKVTVVTNKPAGTTKDTTGESTKTGTTSTTNSAGTAGSGTTSGNNVASGNASSNTSEPSSSTKVSAGNNAASGSAASSGTTTVHEHTWTPTYKAVYHPAEYKDNVMRVRLVPNNYLLHGFDATDYFEFPVDQNGNIIDVTLFTEAEINNDSQKKAYYDSYSKWVDHCIDELGHTYGPFKYYLDSNGNPTMASKTMVKAAWTEYVIDGYRCTTCGATKSA